MKTNKEIYKHCRRSYYCSDDKEDENYNQLCEEYETWSDEDVEEKIQEDVVSMKSFLKIK